MSMRPRPHPVQLELFPTAVRLIRCTPARNENRFYVMTATPTLFGDWTLIREWGRRGSPGRLRHDPHRSVGEAISALLTLQRQKLRRGYRPAWA
jgi:predicted DNA-binding WGR domain protein